MELLLEQFSGIQQFFSAGGNILWLIAVLSLALWCLIIERFLFFKFNYPQLKQQWLEQWGQRDDKASIHSRRIRSLIISEAKIAMRQSLAIIKMLIRLCPLMGLLGTVNGMIHVFDVMAVTGNGNARAMADGVSQATIPTMAGMVIAIAGLYFSQLIEERVNDETHHLADLLQNH